MFGSVVGIILKGDMVCYVVDVFYCFKVIDGFVCVILIVVKG